MPVAEIERELVGFSKERPMGLVLPSLFSELEGPALGPIIDHIAQVPYLDEIVIGLDRANQDQYQYALKYFDRLPQRHRVLWNDGPRLREIDSLLKQHGLAPKELGKGRNVWYWHDCLPQTGQKPLPATAILLLFAVVGEIILPGGESPLNFGQIHENYLAFFQW